MTNDDTADFVSLLGWHVDPGVLVNRLSLHKVVLPQGVAREMFYGLTGRRLKRDDMNIPHDPFDELVAVYGGSNAFVRAERTRDKSPTIAVYFPDSHSVENARKTVTLALRTNIDVLQSLDRWPDDLNEAALLSRLRDEVTVETYAVSTEMKRGTASSTAKDPLLYSAIQSLIWQEIDGMTIKRPRSGWLVGRATGIGEYSGCEFALYPPVCNAERDEWLTEVVHIATGTMCGSHAMQVFLNVSTRRWRPLKGNAKPQGNRTFDVFPELRPKRVRRYHTVSASGRHQDYTNSVIRHLLGEDNWSKDYASGGISSMPLVMPRYGTVHGDRAMRLGAGSSYPDRSMLFEELSEQLGRLGFTPIGEATRAEGSRSRVGWSYSPAEKAGWDVDGPDDLWGAIRRTLDAYGYPPVLRIASFGTSAQFNAQLKLMLIKMLGQPENAVARSDGSWEATWGGGELIAVVTAHRAGPMAEKFPIKLKDDFIVAAMSRLRSEPRQSRRLAEEEWSTYSKEQRRVARDNLRQYVQSCLGHPAMGLCLAFSQMPQALAEDVDRYRDPYLAAKQALAEAGYVSQMFLGDIGSILPEKEQANALHRLQSAVEDGIRMLGIPAFREIDFQAVDKREDVTLAALYAIRRNDAPNSNGQRFSLPVASMVHSGATYVALPRDDATIAWIPYPEAMRKLLLGQHGLPEVPTRRAAGLPTISFIRDVLLDINARSKHAVVLVDGPNFRSWMTTMQNPYMHIDRLEFPAMEGRAASPNLELTSQDLPRIRLVRISNERSKMPSYALDLPGPKRSAKSAPSSPGASPKAIAARELREGNDRRRATSGIFIPDYLEIATDRVFITIKDRPDNLQKSNSYAVHSRHSNTNDAVKRALLLEAPRATPTLDEVVVAFMQTGDVPLHIVRLIDEVRGSHFQYDGDTRLPAPLHELELLKKVAFGGTREVDE